MTIDDPRLRVFLAEWNKVRIMLPKRRASGAHIGSKEPRIAQMQIPHGRGQHDDVSRSERAFEDEFLDGGLSGEGLHFIGTSEGRGLGFGASNPDDILEATFFEKRVDPGLGLRVLVSSLMRAPGYWVVTGPLGRGLDVIFIWIMV